MSLEPYGVVDSISPEAGLRKSSQQTERNIYKRKRKSRQYSSFRKPKASSILSTTSTIQSQKSIEIPKFLR